MNNTKDTYWKDFETLERRTSAIERALTGSVGGIGREQFDVTRFGMSAGVADVSKLNAALAAAAVVKGDVFFPPLAAGGRWKIDGSAQLPEGVGLRGYQGPSNSQDKGSVLECTASVPAIIMPNNGLGASSPDPADWYAQKAEIRVQDLEIVSAGDCISVPNGGIDVLLRRLLLLPGTGAKGIHHKGFIQDWHIDDLRIEGWHGSIASSAHYGWYSDAESGVGGDGCRMDDCNFDYPYISGCARGNYQLRIPVSDNVIFKMLRSVTCARHGVVLAGGLGSWELISPNFEANGYQGAGLGFGPTIGSILAGTNTLYLPGAGGIVNGDTLTVRGAADGLNDLVSTVTAGGGTAVVTLLTNAGVDAINVDVTRALYSDLYAGPDLGSPEALGTVIGGGPQNVKISSPGWGLAVPDNALRYAADLSGITAPNVSNAKANVRPMYDPQYLVEPWTDDPYHIAQFIPSRDWQAIPLGTGWTGPLMARRRGRRVEFQDFVTAGSGASSALGTLPRGLRPSRLITIGNSFVPGAVVQIDASGNIVSNAFASTNSALGDDKSFSLD